MNNLCVIPARGGSKRIPHKNKKHFLGKPIIAYSIEAALESNLFSEVIVSTDNAEIAKIAIQYGAKIPFMRSAKNASNFSTTFEVIEEVMEIYEEKRVVFEKVCCVYPCAPFITSGSLQKAYIKLKKNQFTSVFPVIPYSTPIQRAMKLNNGKIRLIDSVNLNNRSQDLEQSYFDAGQFYWMDIEKVLSTKSIITENSGAIILSEMEGQDIDTETDWALAEFKFKLLK